MKVKYHCRSAAPRCLLAAGVVWLTIAAGVFADERPLRIIVFGAHPDDCEIKVAGTAAKWIARGDKVKFVSVTNGDIGHWNMAGGPLAQRRKAEVEEAGRRLGVEVEVLDHHDGELLPTLENRKQITRLIRAWEADIVITHRPQDYHPDHRYTSILVQDSAFMVTVPFFCPDTPPLKQNPAFFYLPDGFTKPYPFQADVALSIDDVFRTKVDVVDALESQFYEGGALGSPEVARRNSADDRIARKQKLAERWSARDGRIADRFRDSLVSWYGEDLGSQVKHAEVFELCEYGRRPGREELRRLFPFDVTPAKPPQASEER